DHGLRACDFSEGYLYWIYVYFLVQIILSWVLYLRMRKVAKAFNGFRMAIWTLVIFTSALLINMVINIIEGSNYPWGRITIALANMILINGYLWLILGIPVVGHLFRREQTMRTFINNLHKDSLVAQQTRMHGMQSQLYGMSDNDVYDNSADDNDASLKFISPTAPDTASAVSIGNLAPTHATSAYNAANYSFGNPAITYSTRNVHVL
ncbi:hypothetical protein IWW38_004775, partial [Coemansia aciculifera]